MHIFYFLGRILVVAAAAVLVLKGYVAIDIAVAAHETALAADGIASALHDAGILLALGGAMIAIERRARLNRSASAA